MDRGSAAVRIQLQSKPVELSEDTNYRLLVFLTAPATLMFELVASQAADFHLDEYADESAGLQMLLTELKRKLLLVGASALLHQTTIPDFDLGTIRHWLDRIAAEVQAGTIRYLRFNLRSRSA